jgi:methylglyoxal synthase
MTKTIALVAHDQKKIVMAEWTNKYKEILKNHHLVGTEGTAKMIKKIANLQVEALGHGPDGGDIVVANEVLSDKIDMLIFFIDAKTPHGHEHDIQTLIRISVIKEIPLALNMNTADYLIENELIKEKKEVNDDR